MKSTLGMLVKVWHTTIKWGRKLFSVAEVLAASFLTILGPLASSSPLVLEVIILDSSSTMLITSTLSMAALPLLSIPSSVLLEEILLFTNLLLFLLPLVCHLPPEES